MTQEEFQFAIETKRELEFTFKGSPYTITYGKDGAGKPYVALARLYESPELYYSLKEMLAHAKIGNHFLRELVKDIPITAS